MEVVILSAITDLLPTKVPIERWTWLPILQSWSIITPAFTIVFFPIVHEVLINVFAIITVPSAIITFGQIVAEGWIIMAGFIYFTASL